MSKPIVLVVDDNATTRKLFRLALEAEDYEVVDAATGADALDAVTRAPVGVVLLDCRLPDIPGTEVARRIRNRFPTLPVVAVTGWAQHDEMMLDAGFAEVIVKPVVPSRLVEVVRHYLNQSPPSTTRLEKRALVVDDDPTQRKLVQVALTAAGFDVTTAEDGASGVKSALANVPQVVLSDVLMPHMDGFELCRAFRSDPVLARVPIVLVSAHYLEEEDRELGKRFGASRYVSRGNGLDALVAEVIAALDPEIDTRADAPPWDLRDQYLRRVAHQLERQAALSSGYARRASLQATAMSILGSISDALARQVDPESALDETLNQCLDAAGLSVGAILLFGEGHRLFLRAEVGIVGERTWTEHAELLEKALSLGTLVVPSDAAGRDGDELLAKARIATALVVPIVARDEAFGVLILGSGHGDFAGPDGESFARAVRSVATQLGQALALSRLFSRLVAAEERYRVLFDNARDVIAILNPAGVILEINQRCQEIMGVSRDSLVGRHISEFSPESHAITNVSEYEAAVAKGGGSSPPTPIQRQDGSIVHVEFSSTVVEVGGESLVLAIGRDVTDRFQLAEQFRHAQKLEAVGRLAGGVAHDMNNILGVVLTYSQLLQGALDPKDPRREDAVEIEAAAERGASLTRQLLAFSRQQVVQMRVLDLSEIVRNLKRMLQTLIGEDIRLETNLASDLPGVRVDVGTFEQVIMNLAVNSRDAMPHGGRLTITTEGAGGRVLLRVTDTGTGMDANTLQHVFEPFFTTKETGKGTGLGLAMVFGIVKQCGGEIYVDSALGRGTTFAINLPAAPKSDAKRVSERSPPPVSRGKETIVVVEDEDALRRAIVRGLSDAGYNVISAQSGPAVFVELAQHSIPVDLLLTDVVLPSMSGPEIAGRLRLKDPDMKILFMSGYTDTTAYPDVPVGGPSFLQKPFTPQALALKVRAVLDASD